MARKKLISVSRDYNDVWETIEELVADDRNVSEYACKAMRFYKRYKDSFSSEITEQRIREIFKEEFQKLNIQSINLNNDKGKRRLDEVLSSDTFQNAFDSFDNSIENM